jgi:hypothetical protein
MFQFKPSSKSLKWKEPIDSYSSKLQTVHDELESGINSISLSSFEASLSKTDRSYKIDDSGRKLLGERKEQPSQVIPRHKMLKLKFK